MRTRAALALVPTLAMALVGLAGCGAAAPAGPVPAPAPAPVPATSTSVVFSDPAPEPMPVTSGSATPEAAAAQLKLGLGDWTPSRATTALAGLKVATPGSTSGYSRTEFPHWRDASTWGWPAAPSNSCNARNAALYRDGRKVTLSSTCTRLAGSWVDPYGGTVLTSVSDVDIDHMVPLAEAWRSGASRWTTAQRTAYANAPLVLVSTDDSLNQSKGDKDPAAWLPPLKTSRCLYAVRWTAVKSTYKMTVDSAEKAKLASLLKAC